jgi:hypothetical protein
MIGAGIDEGDFERMTEGSGRSVVYGEVSTEWLTGRSALLALLGAFHDIPGRSFPSISAGDSNGIDRGSSVNVWVGTVLTTAVGRGQYDEDLTGGLTGGLGPLGPAALNDISDMDADR